MRPSDVDLMRYAHIRGDILRTLKEDYTAAMTSVRDLQGALDAQGTSLSREDLEFHLTYLADQEYVRIWRASDMPGFRRDRPGLVKADTMMFGKLLPKGLQLLDGLVTADPAVRF